MAAVAGNVAPDEVLVDVKYSGGCSTASSSGRRPRWTAPADSPIPTGAISCGIGTARGQ